MCLSIAIDRPDDVLAKGVHAGFEWMVIHNGQGYRCGYVKVPKNHPWYGKHYDDVSADVHGGLTFAKPDRPCEAGGPDDGFWFGFDCAHSGDAIDPSLPHGGAENLCRMFLENPGMGEIRTQEYVEAECRSLCDQAASAS